MAAAIAYGLFIDSLQICCGFGGIRTHDILTSFDLVKSQTLYLAELRTLRLNEINWTLFKLS